MLCRRLIAALCLVMLPRWCAAQASQHALRFFGTGVGPPGFQDRVLIPLDDNTNAIADGSAPADIGNGSFTLEWWMRGNLADNATASSGGDQTFNDNRWIEGNIILDRDIWCGSERKFGISIAGGFVRFGTSAGDPPGADAGNSTIEGNRPVLDGQWHHVAVVRDAGTGARHIYVDGQLDYSGPSGMSQADLSYPNNGVPVTGTCGTGQLTPYGWYLVIAAEKHDAGAAYPSYNGYFDELRIWNTARSSNEIAANRLYLVATNAPGLVGCYRFEEGSGTNLADSSAAGSYTAQLRAGVAGNGQWVARSADTNNTAPVMAPGNQPPVAVAAASPTLGPAPLLVQFDASASSDPDGGPEPLAFAWTFGDGDASAQADPAHSYAAGGLYTAILRVADGTATGTASVTIRVGPTSRVELASVPGGVPLVVNGTTGVTPFALTTLAGDTLTVGAPGSATANGTALVFRCWSDGGAREHARIAPAGSLLLRAGYAPLPGGALDIPVPAANRNAESYAGSTAYANVYDANGLCCGRDSGGRYEAALAFPLNMPAGATVAEATLTLRASADQSGAPQILIRAYATSNVAAFVAGSGSSVTGLLPLTSAGVPWAPVLFTPGQTYTSPALTAVVQEVVDRPDWAAGHVVGLVLAADHTSGDHWRCWRNFQSGTPPVLRVSYSTGGGGNGDVDGDGLPDDWESAHALDCTSGDDATGDGDGDRIANGDEYVAGTNPTNANDFQRLEITAPGTSNDWNLVFATVTGRVYRVEYATQLAPPDWQPLATNLPGSGLPVQWPVTNSTGPRFYRSTVRLAP